MVSVSYRSCPECFSTNLTFKNGEFLCNDCGLLFTSEEAEAADMLEGNSAGTAEIASSESTADNNGKSKRYSLESRIFTQAQAPEELQLYNIIKTSSSTERRIVRALSKIEKISTALGLDAKAKRKAAEIYRLALEKGILHGRSIDSIACASIYIACRKLSLPITIERISKISRLRKKVLISSCKVVLRELDLKLEPANAEELLYSFCNKLGLSRRTKEKAIQLLSLAIEKGLTNGKMLHGVIGAVIYLACNSEGDNKERRTQREISWVVGVTEMTIIKRIKEVKMMKLNNTCRYLS